LGLPGKIDSSKRGWKEKDIESSSLNEIQKECKKIDGKCEFSVTKECKQVVNKKGEEG